jgi:hypothetical protein
MATRGQIAYLANPNTIFTTYIHYDAYPQGLGKTLTTYFNSDNEAEDIVMNGGNIRSIDDEGTIDRFDDGGANQLKDETPEDLFNYLYDHADGSSADYVYVWLEDKWITLDMNKGRQYFVGTLLDSIRKIEPTMENKNKIKEGTWSVLPARIPEFIKAMENLKEEFHSVVGDDTVFNHLDAAIEAAQDLMPMGSAPEIPGFEGTKDKLDDLFESQFVRKMKHRAGIIK